VVIGGQGAFSQIGHSHSWGEISGKPATFTPSAHTHDWSEVTGKPATFAPSYHTHDWSDVTGKPSTFTPSSHSHSGADITSGTIPIGVTWNGAAITSSSIGTHSHVGADIVSGTIPAAVAWAGQKIGISFGGTGQSTATAAFVALAPSQTGHSGKFLTTDGTNVSWATVAAGSVAWGDITGKPTTFTPSSHSHSGTDITSGAIPSGVTWNGAIIASTYGGTGNGFTKFTGPATSEKTFTLPNQDATIWNSTQKQIYWSNPGGSGCTLTRFFVR
jgi:hypothetical protein